MKRWGFLILLAALAGFAYAQPLTLQGAVDQALSRNVDYQSALLAVDRARNSLSDGVNWKGIAVSATRKQGSDPAAANTSLGINLPLFDQLAASATVDDTGKTQATVTATPLAHSDTAAQARIAYDKAALTATQARLVLETAVRKAWLAQASAATQLTVQTQTAALLQTAYQDAKARYDKGTVTLAEVRAALKAWTDARGDQTTAERALVKAEADLASRLQVESVELVPLDTAALQKLVEGLGPVDAAAGASTAVQLQALELESQVAKADALWWLDPGLSVSANAVVPPTGNATWSGSVTLSLALGSWQGSDRAVADRAVDLARRALEAQTTSVRSTQAQALLAVQSAQSTVDSRGLALGQAQDLLKETQLLVRAGKATALDEDQARLGVASAENDLFQAWADVYGARLDLEAARS
jgi:outer membrane protein TolC